MTDESRPPRENLWLLTAAPFIWLAHLLLSYITGAVWCAKIAGRGGSLGAARAAIAVYTLLALAGLALVGWRAMRRRRPVEPGPAREYDAPGDRDRFLGRTTLLLTGLSALAVVYAALVALFIRSCR
ncbi:hypothetical protein [Nannocystis pusilla]|uniref:Uncharacterized protein n=1 Tax=Nannocystis pusilla TaxID=889268 RepID=A0ABS7U5F4_9BACT|nr:hypothetical protein [Nannocystis pusilla]MBZ5715683.1 hypothetical protein [Nannocystis pusilla]